MAGVVAMASVIEDFDIQPCKKTRKDAGNTVVKTITNYFSPVPKPPEKPLFPPRSNNITDYFNSTKPPSAQGTTNPPEKSKENDQRSHSAEKHASPEVKKQPPQKRSRKTSRALRKQSETAGLSDDSISFITDDFKKSKDSSVVGSSGPLTTDTTLLAKVSAEDNEPTKEVEPLKDSYKCESIVKQSIELSPAMSTRNEGKPVKSTPRKARRKQKTQEKHPNETETECLQTAEVNLDEASRLNKSTVKISFEDFLRSQNQDVTEEEMKDDAGKVDVCISTAEPQKVNFDQEEDAKDEENVSPLSVQTSPRTVTVQAEVHPVSSKHEPVGNVASIFKRNRAKSVPTEKPSSPQTETGQQIHSPNVKRKSNVVIEEEDLEVLVLESEMTPKCSETERKQFMAAFKQPSTDGSKTKAVKMQSKEKQAEEKISDDANKVAEDDDDDDGTPATVEEASPKQKAKIREKNKATEDDDAIIDKVSLGKKAAKNKLRRKKKSKSKETKKEVNVSSGSTAVDETEIKAADVKEESKDSSFTSTPLAVRRSRREAVVRNTQSPTTPLRKTRRSTASSQESPLNISTPKTPKSKHGVFVAEILSPPDLKESPIRIRFSRVRANVPTSEKERGHDKSISSTNKMSRKQAKKLVKKAKVMQQSKKSSEAENTLRRSSRAKTSLQRSYCEDEDSIIFVEEFSSACSSKTQKPLRSLNDVLGKATSASKEAQAAASLGQKKSTLKVSAVVSIFDEGSKDGSENSKDDEQFRARREFLKSGLPESFKKQIAKDTATKEAYTLFCSTFQTVTHTTQQNDCPLWSLPWPESSSLTHLRDVWSKTSNSFLSIKDSFSMKTLPTRRNFVKKVSGWRPEIPENVRQLLLEEFRSSNPEFPAQIHIDRLLKRRADHHQQLLASAEQAAVTRDLSITQTPAEPVGGKRKRKDDEGGNSTKAKKQRSTLLEENTPSPRRRGRPRRAQKAKPGKEEKPEPAAQTEKETVVIEEERTKVVINEDIVWTEKYQPQHSGDIIDNPASVKKLYNWLKEWKLRADREERKNQKEKKHEEGSGADWESGGDDSLDGDDMLCNTMLITGPSGAGKTASVYACAQELGFKVFEVNASSQRSGRLILSQLREATQSHQVDSQGVNAHKPAYFNNYVTSTRPGSSPRKGLSPARVVSSPRKNPQSPRGAKKGRLAPISLANFFKINQPNKEPPKTKTPEQTAASGEVRKVAKSGKMPKDPPTEKSDEQSKKTPTSLILFEEVDVFFEDDSGFLAAVKTFMTTTKRPVILTTSDPAFGVTFDGSFDEIHFKTPSIVNVCSYLQLLCLAEDVRTNQSDVRSLLRLNGCDIRQSLLQLQFWIRSAGRSSTESQTHASKNVKSETEFSAEKSFLPPSDFGCTESKLGLFNIEPERNIWELFRSQTLMEEPVCWELLMPSRRQRIGLLYSNMETLLPLPRTELTTSKPPLSDTFYPSITSESADCSDSESPLKISTRMKKNKLNRLPVFDGLHSEPDSEDEFVSFSKPLKKIDKKAKEQVASERLKKKVLTPEERTKSLPVSQCLKSIADFLDDISYIDSCLISEPLRRSNHEMANVLKDGMTDESRMDADGGSWSMQSLLLEVQTAVEALSFSRCRASVAEAWEKIQRLKGEVGKEAADEVSLPVSAHQEGRSFTQDGPCHPELIEKRKDMIEDLMLRSTFGPYGNKQAAALEYLPAMRNICRSERLKERGKQKRRFLHYLDTISMGLEKRTLKFLAEGFP